MIKRNNGDIEGLLLNIVDRKAGSMVRDGETIEWDAGDIITLLPIEDAKGTVRKLRIHPSAVESFYSATENLHWAALVKVSVEDRFAVRIEVVADLMEDYYNVEL
jgi:hypothetical protein